MASALDARTGVAAHATVVVMPALVSMLHYRKKVEQTPLYTVWRCSLRIF